MTHRLIELHDLVLFTTNTGEFYQLHKLMARNQLSVVGWMDWLRDRVLPYYCKQIEPVTYDYDTLLAAARELKAYYEQHIIE